MVRQEVRDIDIAALSYLIFIQECKLIEFSPPIRRIDLRLKNMLPLTLVLYCLGEKAYLHKDIIELNKSLLFSEMHTNFVQTYGFEFGGIRFANLLCLLNDMLV